MMVPPFDTLAFSAAPGYEMAYTNSDNTLGRKRWLYNGTGAATVAGKFYTILEDGDEETGPKVIAADAVATVQRECCVAEAAVASGAFGWFFIEGWCSAYVEGTTDVAKDDYLKIAVGAGPTDAAFAAIKDGTSETQASVAISSAAQATNSGVLTRVRLLGKRAVINT
jgi:hypothetical protein